MQNDFMIDCEDGQQLVATHFGEKGKPAVIIAAAVGAKRGYYAKFAQSLVGEDFQVVTFDYRGIGESKAKLNDASVTMSSWGEKDLTAVINWLCNHESNPDIYLVGHSVAGQIFPLAKNRSRVKAAYFIASQTASSSYWDGKEKFRANLLWNLFLPTTTSLTGKLPSWAYGGKHDLPKYAAKEWGTWGRHINGVLQDCEKRATAFKEINIPLKFISISDDKLLAPKRAVERLYSQYGSTYKDHQHWFPEDFGKTSIGHFGFFRSANSDLWRDTHLWLKKHL